MNQTNIQKAFDDLNAKYLQALKDLDHALDIIQQHQPVDPNADDELKNAAKVMAQSEMNKEDLSEQEIYEKLALDQSAAKNIGFWAMPLPKDTTLSTKKYTGKPK